MLTQEEAKELVQRDPLSRRRPTAAFYADRAATRARRQLDGRPSPIHRDEIDWVGLWKEMYPPMVGGASYFNLVIDTTAPAGVTLSLNGNAATTTSQAITAAVNTSDSPTTGYQILVWGDVDPGANASIQPTQGASSWITPGSFPANQAVTLSDGDATKTINIRVRDDVWNESATVTQTIRLDTTAPTVDVTTAPDATKLSTVAGKRTVNFSFTVGSEDAVAWEVMVVPSGASLHSAGSLIGTANGSTGVSGGALTSGSVQAVTIDGRDIVAASAGDGTKVIKVFVQDAAGIWSTV